MSDYLKVVIEQAVGGVNVQENGSRTTYEVFGNDNNMANAMNIGITEAVIAEVKAFAAQKAAANPTG